MKPVRVVALLCVGVLCVAGTLVAGTPSAGTDSRFPPATLDRIERSLVMALESNSPGMHTSAALTLWQVRSVVPDHSFELCVIPLMRIVKSEKYDPTSRVVAAIALHQLHSGRGDFAIQRTGMFADEPRVRHICTWLAHEQIAERMRAAGR